MAAGITDPDLATDMAMAIPTRMGLRTMAGTTVGTMDVRTTVATATAAAMADIGAVTAEATVVVTAGIVVGMVGAAGIAGNICYSQAVPGWCRLHRPLLFLQDGRSDAVVGVGFGAATAECTAVHDDFAAVVHTLAAALARNSRAFVPRKLVGRQRDFDPVRGK